MKSFLKKKDPTPEDDNDPPISPTKTAISSKFSFDDDNDEGNDDKNDNDDNDDNAKSSKKKKIKKKSNNEQQSQQVVESEDGIEIKNAKSESPNNRSSSSKCCTCKRLICSTICISLLAAISILTWRYGPWSKDSAQVELFTITSNTNCATNKDNDNCCNGLASNCNLPVNEVLFPMVHAAHSSYDNNFVGAHNNKGFEGALVMGYRALQLSTCLCEKFVSAAFLLDRDEEWGLGDSDLGFCDTKCLLGVRDPKDVL
mmetsp:Transcript_10461/g.18827  ORF Transcript_10461/g.18827 Transcript_10461/m.18827 type:complete len:257 (+) Transcript_10461:22-792(+)